MGGTLIASTLLNGVYPAIFLSSFKPLNFFRGINTLKIKKATFRKALVTVQFTVSVILIIGTIVITKQLYYIEHTDPGYDRSQIFSFNIPYKVYRHYNEGRESFFNSIKQELLSQSSIKGVTLASQSVVNLTSTNSGSADWDGHDTSYTPTVSQLSADPNFKNVMGLSLKEGRWFLPDNKGDEHNFILNETAVRQFNIHTPVLGQKFTFAGDTGQIIGIVKDFHFKSLHEEIAPLAIFNRSFWRSTFFIKTQNGKAAQALREANEVWKKFVSSEAFDYTFLDESFDKLYKTEQRTSKLVFLFSAIAIVISALGLFGLTMFSIEQRTKEIGIRKVLGARVYHVLSLLSKDFIVLIIIASAIAFPIAWWGMNKWLSDFAYRINIGWWIFVLAGLISLLIATVTISVQGIKAATANPVKNLRTE